MYKHQHLDSTVKQIIGAAISVHKELGPGLLESAYQKCLAFELQQKGLIVQEEIALPIVYKKVKLDHGYRIDLLVNKEIVLELKTVEQLTDVHTAQILTYMRLGKYPVGLLLNFHVNFSSPITSKDLVNSIN